MFLAIQPARYLLQINILQICQKYRSKTLKAVGLQMIQINNSEAKCGGLFKETLFKSIPNKKCLKVSPWASA